MGRPTDYKEEYDDLAYKLTLLGHTDKELAVFFDVAESTLNLWKLNHPSFSESIKKGKEIADIDVVGALRKRAMGYQYDEVTIDGTEEAPRTKVTTKEIAPDVTAQIFWLKNRQPKVWRDKQEIEATGDININFNLKVIDE